MVTISQAIPTETIEIGWRRNSFTKKKENVKLLVYVYVVCLSVCVCVNVHIL